STQEIFNASLNDSGNSKYIQGWSHKHRRPITLLADRIIKTFDDIDEADFFLQSFDQEQSHEVNLPKISRLSSPKTMDICFTGFPKEEKETLTKLAEENGMLVRKSVTKHLNILCFGENAGPVKLAQASFQGVIIVNRTQLEHLLATGEIPDALADDIKVKDTVPRKKTQNELVSEINKELTGLKEYSRRENLIAIFENNKAVGWKFHVTEFFKEMLDIKLTSVVINSQSFNSWTQG
ncbi:BRCT domain-containing protein, partial [Vibrio anguillarum]